MSVYPKPDRGLWFSTWLAEQDGREDIVGHIARLHADWRRQGLLGRHYARPETMRLALMSRGVRQATYDAVILVAGYEWAVETGAKAPRDPYWSPNRSPLY